MTVWMIGFAYLMPLAVGLLMLAMPRLTRGSTFFAVTVPSGFATSAVGHAIERRYRVGVFAMTLLALAAITPTWWLLDPEPALAVAHTVGVLVVTFGSLAVFIHCRGQAMVYSQSSETRRTIELTPPERLVDLLPRPLWLHLLPYLPVLAALGWLALNADAVAAAAPELGAFEIYGAGLTMLGTLAFMHLIMPLPMLIRRLPGHRSRVVAINWMLLWMMVLTGLLGGWNTLVVLYGADWIMGTLGAVVNVGLVLGILLVPIVMWRLGHFARPGTPDEGDRSPDAAWKLGMIYFNPDDPALWLEKRFGVGYTLNFGRPMAWVIIGALLGGSALLVWVSLP